MYGGLLMLSVCLRLRMYFDCLFRALSERAHNTDGKDMPMKSIFTFGWFAPFVTFTTQCIRHEDDNENRYRDLVHCLQPFRFVSYGIATERKGKPANEWPIRWCACLAIHVCVCVCERESVRSIVCYIKIRDRWRYQWNWYVDTIILYSFTV